MGLIAATLWLQFELCGFLEPIPGESGSVGYAFGEAPNLGPLWVRQDAIGGVIGLRSVGQSCTILIVRGHEYYVRGSWPVISCRVDQDLPHCQK